MGKLTRQAARELRAARDRAYASYCRALRRIEALADQELYVEGHMRIWDRLEARLVRIWRRYRA